MRDMHKGHLLALSAAAFVVAVAIGAASVALDIAPWAVAVIIVVAILLITFAARRAYVGRWRYERRSWTGTDQGRQVELIFDERGVFLNRLLLMVDGKEVDRDTIWYGLKELHGGGVTVIVGSGWIGECTGAAVRDDSGNEHPLSEQGRAR